MNENQQLGNIVAEIRYVVGWYNQNNDKSQIIEAIVGAPVDEDVQEYKVYIQFDEGMSGVDRGHFTNGFAKGHNSFKEFNWKC